jgi:hypothetical protein
MRSMYHYPQLYNHGIAVKSTSGGIVSDTVEPYTTTMSGRESLPQTNPDGHKQLEYYDTIIGKYMTWDVDVRPLGGYAVDTTQ